MIIKIGKWTGSAYEDSSHHICHILANRGIALICKDFHEEILQWYMRNHWWTEILWVWIQFGTVATCETYKENDIGGRHGTYDMGCEL